MRNLSSSGVAYLCVCGGRSVLVTRLQLSAEPASRADHSPRLLVHWGGPSSVCDVWTPDERSCLLCTLCPVCVCIIRMIQDPVTGKPRGFGFCEFEDAETAMSACRNLAGRELNGRPLRIDSAMNAPGENFRGGCGMWAGIRVIPPGWLCLTLAGFLM